MTRLQPAAFRPDLGWYHIPEIDALAHRIYPLVREAVDSGRTIDGDFIAACVRAHETAKGRPGSGVTPRP